MWVVLVVALLVECVCGNEAVVVRWREDRDSSWVTQPSEASPLFGFDTKLAIPRPLSGSQRREMEFSIGKMGNRVETPFLLVYEPDTLELVTNIELVVEFSGRKLLAVRHSATYEKLSDRPSRVFVSVTVRWKERGMDSWSGWMVWTTWLTVCGVFVSAIVSLDEYMRNRAFVGETSVTKHHSNSPVVKRHLRAAGGGGGGSGDVSPVYSPTVVRKEFDTKKTE